MGWLVVTDGVWLSVTTVWWLAIAVRTISRGRAHLPVHRLRRLLKGIIITSRSCVSNSRNFNLLIEFVACLYLLRSQVHINKLWFPQTINYINLWRSFFPFHSVLSAHSWSWWFVRANMWVLAYKQSDSTYSTLVLRLPDVWECCYENYSSLDDGRDPHYSTFIFFIQI